MNMPDSVLLVEDEAHIRLMFRKVFELMASAQYERENNVIGKERIDRLEIEQMFRNKLEKKGAKKKEKKTVDELINIVDPIIPEEHRIIIKEHLETDSLKGVEDTVIKGLIGKRQAGEL